MDSKVPVWVFMRGMDEALRDKFVVDFVVRGPHSIGINVSRHAHTYSEGFDVRTLSQSRDLHLFVRQTAAAIESKFVEALGS